MSPLLRWFKNLTPEANLETGKLDALNTSQPEGLFLQAPAVSSERDKMKPYGFLTGSFPLIGLSSLSILRNKPIAPFSYQNTKNQRLRAFTALPEVWVIRSTHVVHNPL